MVKDAKFAEAIEKLKAQFGQKYVKPHPVYDALNVREIDVIIQLGKENRHPNSDILAELQKEFPNVPGLANAKPVDIRSYPSKVKAEKMAANPGAKANKKSKKTAVELNKKSAADHNNGKKEAADGANR